MAEHLGLEVHYAPGDRPLCGAESWVALYTDDPALVSGCGDCLKLVAEDLGDGNDYMGHCIHWRQGITAPEAWPWRRVVRGPCLHHEQLGSDNILSVTGRPQCTNISNTQFQICMNGSQRKL